MVAVQPDLTDHKLEPVKSLRVPGRRSAVPTSTSLRARNPAAAPLPHFPRRLRAACRLCWFHLLPRKARNVGCIQPDLPGQPQCGLRLSKPVKSLRIPERRSAVPTFTSLRARNPTPRRLGALRIWTIVQVGMVAVQPDLPGQPQCGLHLSEPVKSPRIPGRRSAVPTSAPLRARNPAAVPLPHFPRRLGAARVWTFVGIGRFAVQPDLPGQPQCGLHLSEPVKSLRVPGRRGASALIRQCGY